MIGFYLIIISLGIVMILGGMTKYAYRSGDRLRLSILSVTSIHMVLLVVFPVWHAVFFGFIYEEAMLWSVTSQDLLIVMIGEGIFVSMFALGLNMKIRIPFETKERTNQRGKTDHFFLVFLIVMGIAIYMSQLIGAPKTIGEIVVDSTSEYANSLIKTLIAWDRGVFWLSSIVAASMVIVGVNRRRQQKMEESYVNLGSRAKWRKVTWVVALILLLLVFLCGMATGTRGRIVWVLIFVMLMGIMNNRRKAIYASLVIVFLVAPLSTFLSGDFRSIYFDRQGRGRNLDLVAETMTYMRSKDTYESSQKSFWGNFAKRAQGPRNSVVLYRLFDSGQSAGIKAIEGAVVLPIPRMIWPEKRPAGSFNLSKYGCAMYLVRGIGYGAPIYNMGPYLASAHAYWEGGWLWVVVAGFLTGIFWNYLIKWGNSAGVLGIIVTFTFSGALLIDGLPTMLTPLYAILSFFWSAILPMTLVYNLFSVLVRYSPIFRPVVKMENGV
ncbi:MAG: hypothetical protein KKH94_05240 [Candidatus Omnitrophica bacterium]|nr:hypothetical protein [Candidatus Omnitrophota bacterium]